MRRLLASIILATIFFTSSCKDGSTDKCANTNSGSAWEVDFFDDFDTFKEENWQDQRIWVNNEKQCYVPNNEHGTREVSNGSIKLKVIKLDEEIECDNMDKHGVQHPKTAYVAGRIASKNKKEFIKGKWTARLRIVGRSEPSMFPAWWLLGSLSLIHI